MTRKIMTVKMYKHNDFMQLSHLANQVLDDVEVRASNGLNFLAKDLVATMGLAVAVCLNENIVFDVVYPDYATKFESFIKNFEVKRNG